MATDQPAADRIVATVALDLIPWVRQISQEMNLNPNSFVNAALHSLREAVEGSDENATVRIVELCRRARARRRGLEGNAVTRSLGHLVARLYPDLPALEERYRTKFLARVSNEINARGQVPSEEELRKIQQELGDENVNFAGELREQRQAAKRRAKQQRADPR